MDASPLAPLELEPVGDEPVGRRRKAVWLFAAAAVVVGLVVAAVAAVDDRGRDDDAATPDLFASAVRNSEALDRLTMEFVQETGDFGTSGRLEADGANFLTTMDLGGQPVTQLSYDGIEHLLIDGTWWEYPSRRQETATVRQMLQATLNHLLDSPATERERNGDEVVFEMRCGASGHPDSLIAERCADDPAAEITVTVDSALVEVRHIRIEGEFPVFVEHWEHGYVEMSLVAGPSRAITAPTEIDLRGVRCLADELGIADATSATINAAIQDKTTRELGDLYTGRCGYPIYPAGTDFGER